MKDENGFLIDLQFLPNLEYFVLLNSERDVVIDQHEFFVKQTYRNRCYILGANSILKLVIPIKSGSQKTPMKDVEIDYTHQWAAPLWRSILSAYGKSPFFEYYSDELEALLKSREPRLFQLNMNLLSFCLKCLEIDRSINFTHEYQKQPKTAQSDLRSTIHPKCSFEENHLYQPTAYMQIFGNKFVPNLSIIDLLFCEGPGAVEILKRSQLVH